MKRHPCLKCDREYGGIEAHYCTTGRVPAPGKCCGAPYGDTKSHYCYKTGKIS